MYDTDSLFTVAIPVYNEGENILVALGKLRVEVPSAPVLLVYDSDKDSTIAAFDSAKPELKKNVRMVRNKYGRGALNAIKTGMESAETKYVVVMMADLCDPPEVIATMVEKAEATGSAVVCASRYMKGGSQTGGPKLKSFLSRTAGKLLHFLAGLPTHDPTNSFKLYRTDFLKTQTVESNGGFEIGIELTVKAWEQGLGVSEVPTSWKDRVAGKSNFKLFSWLPNYLKWFFRAFRKNACRKTLALALLFAIPVFTFAGTWFFLTVNVPYWDDYAVFIKYFSEPWPDRWSYLLSFHNEHRITTTRLIADFIFFLNGEKLDFRNIMAAGNALQLVYASLWVAVFWKSRLGILAALPVFWLLTSFIHYENSCWALCSIQNIAVVLFSFVSCLLFNQDKSTPARFAMALLFATCATFSSGSGLLVWPCLIGMAVTHPIGQTGSWAEGLKKIGARVKARPFAISILLVAALSTTLIYLDSFPGGTVAPSETGPIARIGNAILFFMAFIGGIVPVFHIALVAGAVFFLLFLFIVAKYPRIRNAEIFWFMMIQVATMVSASVFRSADPQTAVSSRYCIVSCSFFASLLFLCIEQLPIPVKLLKRGTILLAAGVIFYTSIFLILGAPRFSKRNETMRRNILTWPNHIEGLRSADCKEDDKYLRKCVERGVYDPKENLKEKNQTSQQIQL